jgi:hypothetical protein
MRVRVFAKKTFGNKKAPANGSGGGFYHLRRLPQVSAREMRFNNE